MSLLYYTSGVLIGMLGFWWITLGNWWSFLFAVITSTLIPLFELNQHSNHHDNPRRSYTILRHHHLSLQLPTGYSEMIAFKNFHFHL
jgi:hypothetical protein